MSFNSSPAFVVAIVFLVFAVVVLRNSIKIVPQQSAWVIERFGRFHRSLLPGLSFIIPFIDRVAYIHSLKEIPFDTPSQVCITKDNTQLTIDGILYFQVTDPRMASYGASNVQYAISQLAQTTLRSVIGRLELDRIVEEREFINTSVVQALDEAATTWGVKVLRFEIKDLTPPTAILQAMQSQITAEREKRAVIAASEGKRQEQINIANGERAAEIARSEGDAQAAINIAEGQAKALLTMAQATAEAIALVGKSISAPGGEAAVNAKLGEAYIKAFGEIAKTTNTLVIPANLADLTSLISSATTIVKSTMSKNPS